MVKLSTDLSSTNLQLLAGGVIVAILVLDYLRYKKGKLHLKGPTPYPIFGNLPQMGKVSGCVDMCARVPQADRSFSLPGRCSDVPQVVQDVR